MNKQIILILKGGLSATAVMSLLMSVAHLMGIPKMLIGEMLANFMRIPAALGWLAHFMIGMLLAAAYLSFWKDRLPGKPAVKGLLFALIPFLMSQLLVMPIMGAGIFSINTPVPILMVIGSLMGHLVYGTVLGIMIKESLNPAPI